MGVKGSNDSGAGPVLDKPEVCFAYGCVGEVHFRVQDQVGTFRPTNVDLLTCNDHLGDCLGNVAKVLAMGVGDSVSLDVTRLKIRVAGGG